MRFNVTRHQTKQRNIFTEKELKFKHGGNDGSVNFKQLYTYTVYQFSP